MIIDADCHISSHKFDDLAMTADELVEHMDRARVDKALVWLKPPYNRDIEPENRAVYEATLKYPDRFLGFGWANPRLGEPVPHLWIAPPSKPQRSTPISPSSAVRLTSGPSWAPSTPWGRSVSVTAATYPSA